MTDFLDFDQWLVKLKGYVVDNGGTVSDFNPYSTNIALLSAFAAGGEDLDSALAELLDRFFIDSSEDLDLDNRLADIGMARKAATPAAGSCACGKSAPAGQDILIPAGTILRTQLAPFVRVLTTVDATLIAGATSVAVSVEAIDIGYQSNLLPGATLELFGSIVAGIETFVVTSPGLTGGVDRESDAAYRARVPAYIAGLGRGTRAAIRAGALAHDGVTSVGIDDATTGAIAVYLDPGAGHALTADQVAAILADLRENWKPAGCSLAVTAAIEDTTAIACTVYPSAGFQHSALVAPIQAAIAALLNGKQLGETLYLSELVRAGLDVTGVGNFTVQTPTADHTPATGHVIRAGAITVS